MLRSRCVFVAAIALAAACSKSEPPAPGKVAPAPSKAAPAATARRVPIEVTGTGYEPHTVKAEPGEDLVLVFTRTADTECGRYITVQGSEVNEELPMNQPVEVAVEAPASGELVFACGMDMMHGIVTTAQ